MYNFSILFIIIIIIIVIIIFFFFFFFYTGHLILRMPVPCSFCAFVDRANNPQVLLSAMLKFLYPISTLPEHLHSTLLSHAKTT